jgi:hypothetical protein
MIPERRVIEERVQNLDELLDALVETRRLSVDHEDEDVDAVRPAFQESHHLLDVCRINTVGIVNPLSIDASPKFTGHSIVRRTCLTSTRLWVITDLEGRPLETCIEEF